MGYRPNLWLFIRSNCFLNLKPRFTHDRPSLYHCTKQRPLYVGCASIWYKIPSADFSARGGNQTIVKLKILQFRRILKLLEQHSSFLFSIKLQLSVTGTFAPYVFGDWLGWTTGLKHIEILISTYVFTENSVERFPNYLVYINLWCKSWLNHNGCMV